MAYIIAILGKEIKAWDKFNQRHKMEEASGIVNAIDEDDDSRCVYIGSHCIRNLHSIQIYVLFTEHNTFLFFKEYETIHIRGRNEFVFSHCEIREKY